MEPFIRKLIDYVNVKWSILTVDIRVRDWIFISAVVFLLGIVFAQNFADHISLSKDSYLTLFSVLAEVSGIFLTALIAMYALLVRFLGYPERLIEHIEESMESASSEKSKEARQIARRFLLPLEVEKSMGVFKKLGYMIGGVVGISVLFIFLADQLVLPENREVCLFLVVEFLLISIIVVWRTVCGLKQVIETFGTRKVS